MHQTGFAMHEKLPEFLPCSDKRQPSEKNVSDLLPETQ